MEIKVKDLRKILKEFDGDDIVIIQKDGEGNNHSPLSGVWEASYKAESTYDGRVGIRELTAEDIAEGYDEEDVVKGVNCIVLYPIN